MFPDLADDRILLGENRAETTAVIAATLSGIGAYLILAATLDGAANVIQSCQPSLVLVATAIPVTPFPVVTTGRDSDVPVLTLDLDSVGPEISDGLRQECRAAPEASTHPGCNVARMGPEPDELQQAGRIILASRQLVHQARETLNTTARCMENARVRLHRSRNLMQRVLLARALRRYKRK
jgi:hypothetical protein